MSYVIWFALVYNNSSTLSLEFLITFDDSEFSLICTIIKLYNQPSLKIPHILLDDPNPKSVASDYNSAVY